MGAREHYWQSKGIKLLPPPSKPRVVQAISGSDVLEWQGGISWGAYNRSWVAIRTDWGSCGRDRQGATNLAQVRARSIPHWAYHYAYPQYNSAASEARCMASDVGGLRPGEDLVLDVEEPGNWVAWSLTFLQTLQSLTGVRG